MAKNSLLERSNRVIQRIAGKPRQIIPLIQSTIRLLTRHELLENQDRLFRQLRKCDIGAQTVSLFGAKSGEFEEWLKGDAKESYVDPWREIEKQRLAA